SYLNDLIPIEPYAISSGTTPSFESSQAQLNSAPGGVDARAAWTLPGGDGTGTQVIDIEYGWQLTHEDLSKGATAIMIGVNSGDNDHGTAVLGEMVADDNSFGMTGISPQADIGYSSVASFSFASCMDQAAAASDPGDCILIELHTPGPHYGFEGRDDQLGYVPMEYWQGNFDAILNAYGVGVIVCEAAGNGREDLDHSRYDDSLGNAIFDTTFRNSHAIMCGAGNPPYVVAPDRSKLGFSNYGERVNLQGYGTNVYTTGYGDLYNGGSKDTRYTQFFSGTSSASPIVTGAVLCLSGVFQQMLGTVIDADSARTLLVATGSPQTQPQIINHIGPRPDLRAALGLLFDPIDSIWYDNIGMDAGTSVGLPISLSNSHSVGTITLPFIVAGDAPVQIDSLSLGPRTVDFGSVSLIWDNRFNGQAAYKMTAGAGSNNVLLAAGTGVVAYLWLTAPYAALLGQTASVDSAWFGTTSHLILTSYFDNGYPDYFSGGSVTITGVACDCSFHGDLNGDGDINVFDIVGVVDVAFREGDPAITDESCPHDTRADYNCDGEINVFDVVEAVDIAFREGSLSCDPCGG
ncbi:MAG: S8 family serine peptidase, partial [Acidobacteria bacterium]|nr:S8 family serine peptidase [Acidobacteriota bacterium]